MDSITLFFALVFGVLVAVAIVVYLLVREFIRSTKETFRNEDIEEVIDFILEAIGWWINKIAKWWNDHFYN